MENNSGGLQRENVSQLLENNCRLRTKNSGGEHHMENNSGGVQMENFCGGQ